MIDVSKLVTDVAAQQTVDASIIALLNTVVASNKDISAQLAAAIAANDPAALAAVQASIDKASADLEAGQASVTAAVTANTPAAPPAP